MQYDMRKFQMGRFLVHESMPVVGMEHKKRFVADGITPLLQATFNVYVRGEFLFEIADTGFSQVLSAGDTSLSLALEVFPVGVVCVERPTTEPARRLCLSPCAPGAWSKGVGRLGAGESMGFETGACVVVLAGEVECDGATWTAGSVFSPTFDLLARQPTHIAFAH